MYKNKKQFSKFNRKKTNNKNHKARYNHRNLNSRSHYSAQKNKRKIIFFDPTFLIQETKQQILTSSINQTTKNKAFSPQS